MKQIVTSLYANIISKRLHDGQKICLPCYMIRQQNWDEAKATVDELLPPGWQSEWLKKGTLVLKQP